VTPPLSPLNFLRAALNPDAYHGTGRRPPFFEGWYFKLVDPTLQHRYAVIPGVFKSRDPGLAHCFVQVLDGQAGRSSYYRYPAEAFRSARGRFEIAVGPNRFSAEGLSLDLGGPEGTLRGELSFSGLNPWPVTLISPGIMGWYAWAPFMQTYHGVVSLDHRIHGQLEVNGQRVDFTGGDGYIEKDWGRSFPSGWVWMQSNHFSQPGTSLTASIATIPWLGRSFVGFIIGLLHEGRLYRFATYLGTALERLEVREERVRWTLRGREHRLEIEALPGPGALLHAPTEIDMGRRIPETMQASLRARLSRLDGTLLLDDTGACAGLEVAGDLDGLVRMAEAQFSPR